MGNNILFDNLMSFQNSYGPDGSINIIPSFGRIIQVSQTQQTATLSDVNNWRSLKGALHNRPADFDPSRYVSFSVKEVVEDPVDVAHIHDYVERSRLSRRLGF